MVFTGVKPSKERNRIEKVLLTSIEKKKKKKRGISHSIVCPGSDLSDLLNNFFLLFR